MKAFTSTMVLGLIMLSIAASVGATEPAKSDIAALQDSREVVAWQARNSKGVDQDQLRSEEQRLGGLIDTLERGGHVDPTEIDRTLNRAGSLRNAPAARKRCGPRATARRFIVRASSRWHGSVLFRC